MNKELSRDEVLEQTEKLAKERDAKMAKEIKEHRSKYESNSDSED